MNSASLPQRIAQFVARDKVGGALMISAAILALVLANSPAAGWYTNLSEFRLGPSSLHLDLTLSTWAADGLLALFFFIVGLELKHELIAGSLRSPSRAAVPVAAAIGGMAVPALVYVVMVKVLGDPGATSGWAIPTATDIAFALAVLAIFGSKLPGSLRTFLLTLAVVDDLLAIIVIAIFYSSGLNLWFLLGSLVTVAAFSWLAKTRRMRWWAMVPLALLAWVLMHESGVHATIAGVLLGFAVPARQVHGEDDTRTHMIEHRLRPLSAGIALPIFAFFSAGVAFSGEGTGNVLAQPVLVAIAVALVAGKLIGVLGTTKLVTTFTRLRLADGLGVRDLLPIGLLTGIGFTVSLLIAELSFPDSEHTAAAKLGVLIGTALATVLAALALVWDSRHPRGDDMNLDGVPDVDTAPYDSTHPDWTYTRSDDAPLQ
ncbi:Na+/H+ antiporter NhaA [Tessaracoccus antarcticus]|uniref:Na(+)/H(+) antiporter NhaA n=1 Tax=Tessaracoccus antarcticus TaxID=2479848 RepID=A0A3M0G7R0_9ACTN|nr:Na+/H+ antiporter NhaA [Tessaracoccus antarcticus]RMB60157.1 Na+/H+ antiporter NhaA [Tessaracoccus antarcticus]